MLRLAWLGPIGVIIACVGCDGTASERWAAWNKKSNVDERTEAARHADQAQAAATPRILPETFLAAGRMLEAGGDVNAAIAQYEKALAANPKLTAAYGRLGIAYQRLGRFADSEKAFNKGLAIEPTAAYLHNNLGYCFLVQGRLDSAEQEFRSALAIRPDFRRARMNLAVLLGNRGRMDESLAEFQRALPQDSAHYNVGLLCLRQQQSADAERHFEQALAINPNCPGAKERLDQLRGRTASPEPDSTTKVYKLDMGTESSALAGHSGE